MPANLLIGEVSPALLAEIPTCSSGLLRRCRNDNEAFMKILVVDDSLLDRKLLIRILMKSGITQEILQAENGEQAMEILAASYMDIGLILLDWQMPKVSGIELMAGMVKIPELSTMPIIMVTASGSEEN